MLDHGTLPGGTGGIDVEANQCGGHTLFGFLPQSFLAHKTWSIFLECDGESESRRNGVLGLGELMAVQRHGRFQPQTVPRPKTGIHHIVLVEIVEHLNDRFGGDAGRDDFESIFPGVARSGDKRACSPCSISPQRYRFISAKCGHRAVIRCTAAGPCTATMVEPMVSSETSAPCSLWTCRCFTTASRFAPLHTTKKSSGPIRLTMRSSMVPPSS